MLHNLVKVRLLPGRTTAPPKYPQMSSVEVIVIDDDDEKEHQFKTPSLTIVSPRVSSTIFVDISQYNEIIPLAGRLSSDSPSDGQARRHRLALGWFRAAVKPVMIAGWSANAANDRRYRGGSVTVLASAAAAGAPAPATNCLGTPR